MYDTKKKFKRKAFIWIRHLCNIISAFIVIFNQYNVSLLNKSINFFKKKKNTLLTPNVWMEVYMWMSWSSLTLTDSTGPILYMA